MISIITPAYNAEKWIADAIFSVQAQTRGDWELIVIDDGSTDGTRAIAEAEHDSRVRVFHQANFGVSAARNRGLDLARGDYVTFLDADDTLPSDALKLRASLLDRGESIDIVHGAVRLFEGGREIGTTHPDLRCGPFLERLVRLEESVFVGVCYMVRREKIAGHRFPTGLSHCEDLQFFLDLANDADLRYAAVPDVIYEYRKRPGSAMTDLDGLEGGYLQLLRHVAGMERISERSRRYLRRRVERILFRSWLRRGQPARALRSRRLIADACRCPVNSR